MRIYSACVLTSLQPLALYMLCGVAPFVLQIALNYVTVRSWWDFHNSTLGRTSSTAISHSCPTHLTVQWC